jgi:dihydroorotase
MVINRRQFLATAVAGAVVGSQTPRAFATGYDLLIKGGRVIDPSVRLDAIRSVAVTDGRITTVESSIAADSVQVIDASGKLVVPGLIDIHTHAAGVARGPKLVLNDGVTGWIDAGTQGADHIAETVTVARSAPQLGRVLINIGRRGIIAEGDTMDLKLADVQLCREAISKHRGLIAGVKARLSRDVAGNNDFEVLRRAQEVASSFNLPVMIHIGQTITPLSRLIGLLKPGDIVTHMFAPPPNSIIDDSGHILPEVLEARRRGVWFDLGNGQHGHMRWDIVTATMKAGFWPDTFSTDWTENSPQTGVVDLPNCMSKLFNFGMTLDEAIARATLKPARVFTVFRGRGTLNVGAPADVAILELRQGTFEFLDNYNNKIIGHQRLFPSGTVLGGKWIPRT